MTKASYFKIRLACYTAIHLLVDCACMFFVMAIISPRIGDHQSALLMLLLYNACAFALPALFGIISDIADRNHLTAAFGCVLVAAGYLFRAQPLFMAVCIGVGNGLYHVGSGRQVLLDSPDRFAPCGIFIAFGALGLWFGRRLGGVYVPLSGVFLCLLFVSSALLLFFGKSEKRMPRKKIVSDGKGALSCVLLLSAVVVIRSYYGTILHYDWNRGAWISLLFTLCIVAGKASGGILADRIGYDRAALFSMLFAMLFAAVSFSCAVCGCISIFFFNMSMPLTLSRMARHLHWAPGFAFGFLMFCLFIGILPTLLLDVRYLFSPLGLAGLCLMSMVLLRLESILGKGCGDHAA